MDKAALNRACSADANPTPGYLFGEISKMTLAGPSVCAKVATFIIGRLKRKSPHVKYKALMVIKHVCLSGRMEFREEVKRRGIDAIKEELRDDPSFHQARAESQTRRLSRPIAAARTLQRSSGVPPPSVLRPPWRPPPPAFID